MIVSSVIHKLKSGYVIFFQYCDVRKKLSDDEYHCIVFLDFIFRDYVLLGDNSFESGKTFFIDLEHFIPRVCQIHDINFIDKLKASTFVSIFVRLCHTFHYQVDFVSAVIIDHYNLQYENDESMNTYLDNYETHLRFTKMFQREETSVTKVKIIVSCTGITRKSYSTFLIRNMD